MLSITVYIFLLYATTALCFSPVGRRTAGTTQVGSKIWFFGGFVLNPDYTIAFSRDFFALNISSSWETSSPLWTDYSYESTLLPATSQATLTIGHDNSSLWFLGDSSFYQYNVSTSQWLAPTISGAIVPNLTESPSPVRDSRGIIYYYGGLLSGATTVNNRTWTLNVDKFTLLPITNNPVGRMFHTATLVNDTQIYIIGGMDEVNSIIPVSMKSIHIYNTITNHWTIVNTTNPPQGRLYHTAVLSQDGNSIIIFGGENYTFFFNDVWVLDVNTFAWKSPNISGDPPPVAAGSSAILVGSQMLLLFGEGPRNVFPNNVFVLDTIKWTWMPSFTALTTNTTNTSISVTHTSTINTSTPSTPNDATQKGGGIGIGVIIGAIIGGAVFLGIVVIVIYVVRRKRRGIRPTSKLIEGEPEYERNRHIPGLMEYERNRHIPGLMEGKNTDGRLELIEYERMNPDEHRMKPDEYKKIKPDEYKKIKPNEYKQSKPNER